MSRVRISREQAKAMGIEVPKRKHKYSAVATEIDGIRFASKKEANRYGELKIMLMTGLIENLQLQPKFELHERGGKKAGVYRGDFSYLDVAKKEMVIEDVKGFRTRGYLAKKRHVEAEYGVKITEI